MRRLPTKHPRRHKRKAVRITGAEKAAKGAVALKADSDGHGNREISGNERTGADVVGNDLNRVLR